MNKFGANYGQTEKNDLYLKSMVIIKMNASCFTKCQVVQQKLGHTLKYEDIFKQPCSAIAKLLLRIERLRESQAEDSNLNDQEKL